MLIVVAILFVGACVAASLKRLAIAVSPTWLDPTLLVERLKRGGAETDAAKLAELGRAVLAEPRAGWEAGLLDALAHDRPGRDALIGEQLTEIDYGAKRMARVPRVCASLCTSAGFLLAALSLRSSLGDPAAFAEASRDEVLRDAVTSAVDIGAIGICGTAFCIAALMHARRASRVSAVAIERLVERVEALDR